MTTEEAIAYLNGLIREDYKEQTEALNMAIKVLETLEEFEKAQIITGGRLNGRIYAYKCGLEDGKRKVLEQGSRWILCSERLPNKNGAYLVTTENCIGRHIEVLDYANDLYEIDNYDFIDKKGVSGWYYLDTEYGYIEVENVIAWMPLPEAYIERGVEE